MYTFFYYLSFLIPSLVCTVFSLLPSGLNLIRNPTFLKFKLALVSHNFFILIYTWANFTIGFSGKNLINCSEYKCKYSISNRTKVIFSLWKIHTETTTFLWTTCRKEVVSITKCVSELLKQNSTVAEYFLKKKNLEYTEQPVVFNLKFFFFFYCWQIQYIWWQLWP